MDRLGLESQPCQFCCMTSGELLNFSEPLKMEIMGIAAYTFRIVKVT